MKKIILIIVSMMLASMVYADGQINIAYTPYTISTPGSYIVVKDLTAGTTNPTITINTSDVTIDLNGHNIYGAGQITDGIWSAAGNNNITITNGVVRDWGHNGISLSGNDVQVSKVKSYNNGYNGFFLGGTTMRVINCIANKNGCDGFNLNEDAIITGSVASYNGFASIGFNCSGIDIGNNCTVTDNKASSNALGIYADNNSIVKDNTANGNQTGIIIGSRCRVIGNTCNDSLNNGIQTQGGTMNVIENNLIINNYIGIYLDGNGNFYASNRASGNNMNYYNYGGNTDGGATDPALHNFEF